MVTARLVKIGLCILIIIQKIIEATNISYNQPKLPACPQWNSNGVTFANETFLGLYPRNIFIDINNTVYATNSNDKQLHIWNQDNDILITITLSDSFNSWGLFVTINGNIYIGNVHDGTVEEWTLNSENGTVVMDSFDACAGLFVDIRNYLYCSVTEKHQVIKKLINNNSSRTIRIAGSGKSGSTDSRLCYPRGIFVTINLDLYVADCLNDRVQLFKYGQRRGITVAGGVNLLQPTAVFLDADDYLFIVDSGHNRIIRTRSNGFYCIIGCSGISGSASSQLKSPYSAAFDNYGNIFVVDEDNHRIQKFVLIRNTSYDLPIIYSKYWSALTKTSSIFARMDCETGSYYYEAIQMETVESGCYDFIGNSTIDIYVYLYKDDFNPTLPTNNLLSEVSRNPYDYQFELQTSLTINTKYTLVVTTLFPNVTGTFTIIATGRNSINFNHIDNLPSLIQSTYASALTTNHQKYAPRMCGTPNHYYEAIQMNVMTSGWYTLSSNSHIDVHGYFYQNYFNPLNPGENYLSQDTSSCSNGQFQLVVDLQSNVTYVLVMTTVHPDKIGPFVINASGLNSVTFKRISIQSIYTSILTKNTQTYARVCGRTNYHYETIQIQVYENSTYSFDDSNSTIGAYGYIYEHKFDPFNPMENLLAQSSFSCSGYRFRLAAHLQMNKFYVLVITTFQPNVRGPFSIFVYGPSNVSLNRTIQNDDKCIIGDRCNPHVEGIGLTLDDILRNDIQQNISLSNQSFLVKMGAVLVMIMFVGGLINSILSLSTFINIELRKVGCGIYLLSSSISSLLTISLLTAKFWFVAVSQMLATVNVSVFRGGCISIEPLLKLFLYIDTWLNACVVVERAVSVSKGIKFNRKKSKYIARSIIIILPLFVMATIIHEPIYRNTLEYTTEKYSERLDENWMNESVTYENWTNESVRFEIEKRILCVINYSSSVQSYNTAILFFHLVFPFIINLFSAFYIIFGTARRRSATRTKQTYKEHALEQLSKHKQLLISPVIVLILSFPRLIISLVPGCVNIARNPWLYLGGYFVSFTPSMLIFAIFVLPSELYMKTFKESLRNWIGPRTHQ